MSLARVHGPGEPDQACDLVAAAIVEEYVRRDPASRLNIRVNGGYGALFVAGEVLSQADFDVSAIVRRTLSTNGVMATLEPFVALEAMNPADAPEVGSKDVVSVFGYATHETPEFFPSAVVRARECAQILEERRISDAEWFWLGSDYTVTVSAQKDIKTLIRLEHIDQKSLVDVRFEIGKLFESRFDSGGIQVNLGGEEVRMGLKYRIGSSGRSNSIDQYGVRLPASPSGVGYHLRHPLNAGSMIARSVARDLVQAGKGKAVMVYATWLPLEVKPQEVRVRNERGENLLSFVDVSRFDLTKIPSEFLIASLATSISRAPFDRSVVLPYETR